MTSLNEKLLAFNVSESIKRHSNSDAILHYYNIYARYVTQLEVLKLPYDYDLYLETHDLYKNWKETNNIL
jgi:hypothetical protein